jgi:putative membrane protein
MKMKGWIYALALSMLSIASCDDDDDNNDNNINHDVDEADAMFAEKAALSNMTEIEFGNLATAKGTDSLVRAYGQMMVTEHTTALNELEDISDDYTNIDWPQSLDSTHQQIKQQLISLNGSEFDSVYISSQINDHQTALTLFQNESTSGKNQQLKNYASKYLPHIEEHLDRADSMGTMFETPRDPEGNN